MKLIFVADGRSPIAQNWIDFFIQNREEVHLISSFPCQEMAGLASFQVIPVGFSQAQVEGKVAGRSSWLRKVLPVDMRTRLRRWVAPFTLNQSAARLRKAVDELKPDLVHAMRIPYEGMLAAEAQAIGTGYKPPLLISVWGNDFTLHAGSIPWMARHTRFTLQQASALHTDCLRDLRLAGEWGLSQEKPAVVLPGGGGIRLEVFHPGQEPQGKREPLVINPRGYRVYVRNDTFFQAIPRVIEQIPKVHFLCPTMENEPQAQKWVADYDLGKVVELSPWQTPQGMAELFRRSQVVVSLTTHDGTPNTLLEGMACGCFPVAGDLESIREWIHHGQNGLLVDAGDPQAAADAILVALSNAGLRQRAAESNQQMIRERAEHGQVMAQAQAFYHSLVK